MSGRLAGRLISAAAGVCLTVIVLLELILWALTVYVVMARDVLRRRNRKG